LLEYMSEALAAFGTLNDEPVAAFRIEPHHDDDFRWVIVPRSEVRRQIELATSQATTLHSPAASPSPHQE
jgi:hypothetical protein